MSPAAGAATSTDEPVPEKDPAPNVMRAKARAAITRTAARAVMAANAGGR
jgi:hypothetical protein